MKVTIVMITMEMNEREGDDRRDNGDDYGRNKRK